MDYNLSYGYHICLPWEKSSFFNTLVRVFARLRANTWQGGYNVPPVGENRVKLKFDRKLVIELKLSIRHSMPGSVVPFDMFSLVFQLCWKLENSINVHFPFLDHLCVLGERGEWAVITLTCQKNSIDRMGTHFNRAPVLFYIQHRTNIQQSVSFSCNLISKMGEKKGD